MRPDKAVIYFTVASGTGYGIIISLNFLFLNNHTNIDYQIKIFISIISFLLITSGLISSTIHLGHPERAWRALSQWKSSWLSREGIFAIITYFPLTLFYFFWIFTERSVLTFLILLVASTFCILTIFCTAKIYSSLKSIPAWHNPLVPPIYILNSLVLGSIITFTIFFYFGIKIKILSNFVTIICLTALFIKLLYWSLIKKISKSNIETATGLGDSKKTSFFEVPHTGKNFLTTEMINKINISKSLILRLSFCIFSYLTPAYYFSINEDLILDQNIIKVTLIIISILALVGMCIERYLFFIESKHTVSLYYGNKVI